MIKPIWFAIDLFICALRGGPRYYAWLFFLSLFILPWLYTWYEMAFKGLIVTGLTDLVSDGLYLSNFIFLVGVAAAAVTVVFPAYAYRRKELKDAVIIGEMLAISAVVMCLLFVMSHMGRPDRLWHMIPSFMPPFRGIFNWPHSMLTWDVVALNGYLGLNVICAFYYLYTKYTGTEAIKFLYLPVVYLAMVWALSIHTVTAFLFGTLPARPMWFHSLLPIKFITTAFASGPALMIVAFSIIRKNTALKISDEAIEFMSQILLWCLGVALFLMMSEVVTEFYLPTEHTGSLKYLIIGQHGLWRLVPWYWASVIFMVGAFLLLLVPAIRKNHTILPLLCLMLFAGIWIDKGMGLLLPGYIPNPIGEFSQYMPTWIEVFNTLGNWAIGLMIFTVLSKCAIGVVTGEVKYKEEAASPVMATPHFDPKLKLNRTMGRSTEETPHR